MSDTIFKEVRYDLSSLMNFVEMGDIGLPDIQRPFVWKNAKIRNLFDSMYRGFPIGYLLLWQNSFANDDVRSIGTDTKQKAPRLLIVDGQQRLTSLYAVVKGIPVIRENYNQEKIEIAFNPLTETFEVADAAIRKDKSFIPNISIVWSKETNLFSVVKSYLEELTKTREITEEDTQKIQNAITKLHSLLSYPFTALELASTVNEEQVSEVFVRINSEGKKLNQSDFILTLMSVFWDEGRTQLESFCRDARKPSKGGPSPYNVFIEPDPDQLLRVSVGLAFKRARLKSVYSILRGKDLETEQFSAERRDEQFETLKAAQAHVLNLQYWHDFFKCIKQAGFRSGEWITSASNLIFCYTLYLIGRTEYGLDHGEVKQTLAKWFFMSNITGRYTSSPESAMEFDLARLRGVTEGSEFLNILNSITDSTLTNDFWAITLPNKLATSSSRSPSLFAFYAAQNILGAKILFSNHKISDLMDPATQSPRADYEKHHLFPKAHLATQGITQTRDTNQIANFALVEWADNGDIGKKSPAQYLQEYKDRFAGKELQEMYYWHALPDNWENMDYPDFLSKRRELMAGVIKDAYEQLSAITGGGGGAFEKSVSIAEIISAGESTSLEFKSSLRVNLHTGEKDPRMEMSCLKTIAGFLNGKGGTLIIGVKDDGEAIGIDVDGFENEDKMNLHLVNLVRDKISPQHMMYVHPHFKDFDGERVFAVECSGAKSPAYVKDGNQEKFFVRTGASTSELTASQTQEYIKQRFD